MLNKYLLSEWPALSWVGRDKYQCPSVPPPSENQQALELCGKERVAGGGGTFRLKGHGFKAVPREFLRPPASASAFSALP